MRTNNRDKLMLRQKEHYRRNKERFRVRQNAYDKAHADHFRELKQTEAYKAKKAEWDRADYERHKEQRKAATKEYASSHPDKYRKYRMDWKRRNPGSHLKYKAIKRGAFVEYVNVAEVYERDLGLCGICGLPVGSGEFQLDHRIPLSRGGEHSYANCQSSHALCNIKKFDRMPEDCAHLWRRS
jgi:5-methylcytosine-specific restriction endonuclease McrA